MHKMQLARLPPDDATAVYNMRLLESLSDTKKNSIVPFSLKFDVHKVVGIQTRLWYYSNHASDSRVNFQVFLVCRRNMQLEKTDLVKK